MEVKQLLIRGLELEDFGNKKQWNLLCEGLVFCCDCKTQLSYNTFCYYCKSRKNVRCEECENKQDPYMKSCMCLQHLNSPFTEGVHEHFRVFIKLKEIN